MKGYPSQIAVQQGWNGLEGGGLLIAIWAACLSKVKFRRALN